MFNLNIFNNAIEIDNSKYLLQSFQSLDTNIILGIIDSDCRYPPITLAALCGSFSCMTLLINFLNSLKDDHVGDYNIIESCVNRPNDLKITPLYYAVKKNSESCTRLLLDAGANPNVQNGLFGDSPMHIACKSNNLDILKLLIQFGGKYDFRTKMSGIPPLFDAVSENSFQCAEYLISLGANVMERTSDGDTPLHYAQLSEAGNHLECTKLLLEHGADVNAKNSDDETPLHLAAENCNDKAIEYLIAHGAEIDVQTDNFRQTPLHLAIRTIDKSYDDDEYDHACDAVKVLLEHHPRLDIKNCDNETPLEYALSESGFPIIRLLIDYGADVKTMLDYYINQSGRTSTLSDFLSHYKAEEHFHPDKYRHNFYDLLHDYLTEEERIPFEAVKRAKREPENAS